MHEFLQSDSSIPGDVAVHLLGIDLDGILIDRAREHNRMPDKLEFQRLDFSSDENRQEIINGYLGKHQRTRFDVIFCFSIVMWIHLNHGDEGLKAFLERACQLTNLLVVEPQKWRCYKTAERRLRRANAGDFPLIDSISCKGNVEKHVDDLITGVCRFERIFVSEENQWGRRLYIYQRK